MPCLVETINCILQQTFTDFEAIVINDGSSDETATWVNQISDRRVKLISQANQGASGARNTGITHASGEYLAFLDADDLWHPTKLEKQVRCLEQHPAIGLVYTWTALIDWEGKPTGRILIDYAEGDVWWQIVERNLIGCGSSPMVRRGCFETVGVFDRELTSVEDWDMWIRIAARYPFAVIKEPLTYYRQLPTSSSKNVKQMEKSFYLVIEKTFQSVPLEQLELKRRSYHYAYICLAWKCLQAKDKDYSQACHFHAAAVASNPRLRYSLECFRLKLALTLIGWFGTDGYHKVLNIIYPLRRRLSQLIHQQSTA
jgi:glycosyltransferase involved in cell wall biosynthesis